MATTWTRAAVAAAALSVTACAEGTSGMSTSQRNALIGAGVGAAAGAAVAGNDTTGALLGGAAGAALGYYTGCRQEGGCFVGGRRVEGEKHFDRAANRYYFVDEQTGQTYWENGDRRS